MSAVRPTPQRRYRSRLFDSSDGAAPDPLPGSREGRPTMPLSRRQFLVGSAAAGTSLFLVSFAGGTRIVRAVPISDASLHPGDIGKFVTPLLIPPVMPRAGVLPVKGGKPADHYEISMRQFTQQILPAGLPTTTVWGYGAVARRQQAGPADPQRAVAHDRGEVESSGPGQVDQRARRRAGQPPAAPAAGRPDAALGQPAGRGRRVATAAELRLETPGRYTGPVPIVTHVHGAVGVGDESDGYAEAWYLPAAERHPGRLRDRGHLVRLLRRQGAGAVTASTWGPGFATFQYPNTQRASTHLVPRPHPRA